MLTGITHTTTPLRGSVIVTWPAGESPCPTLISASGVRRTSSTHVAPGSTTPSKGVATRIPPPDAAAVGDEAAADEADNRALLDAIEAQVREEELTVDERVVVLLPLAPLPTPPVAEAVPPTPPRVDSSEENSYRKSLVPRLFTYSERVAASQTRWVPKSSTGDMPSEGESDGVLPVAVVRPRVPATAASPLVLVGSVEATFKAVSVIEAVVVAVAVLTAPFLSAEVEETAEADAGGGIGLTCAPPLAGRLLP